MAERKDIASLEDVKAFVNLFYEKVRQDELLAPVFNNRIQDNWPAHLEKMYRFWETVLIGPHTYHGSPFLPHMGLPVEKIHFERWLLLFKETLDELFEGELAAEALWRADKMAEMFHTKIEHYRTHPARPLL